MKVPFLKVIALATMLAAEGSIVRLGAVFVRTPPPRPIASSGQSEEGLVAGGFGQTAIGRGPAEEEVMSGRVAGGDGLRAPVQYGFRRGGVEAEVDTHS